MAQCPSCGSEMIPSSDLINRSDTAKIGLPPNFVIDQEFRCKKCRDPIILVQGIWYRWYDHDNDYGWEPYSGLEQKPRKISSNFITGKRLFQT